MPAVFGETANDGSFLLSATPGTYTLLVKAPGFRALERTIRLTAGNPPASLRFLLQVASSGQQEIMSIASGQARERSPHGRACGVADATHAAELRTTNACLERAVAREHAGWACYLLPAVDSTVGRCLSIAGSGRRVAQLDFDSADLSGNDVRQALAAHWHLCAPQAHLRTGTDGALACALSGPGS